MIKSIILNAKISTSLKAGFLTKEFERLKNKNLIECIYCHSKKVEKSIMSPRVVNSNKGNEFKKISHTKMKNFKKDLQNLRKFVENNFEYVEQNFANKVREVYYDKKNKKKYLWNYD